MKPLLLAFILLSAAALPLAAAEISGDSTIYDPNPNHLWNRLNQTLFERTTPDGQKFGLDELDVLYWFRTTNLLAQPSHQRALAVLDEFINSHGEKLISDPLKRALLQRDLWQLFDWSAKHIWKPDELRTARELQPRLVTIMRRVALTTNEIAGLPDNYGPSEAKGLPDLPHRLFDTNGDWVGVGRRGWGEGPVAPTHVAQFNGLSAFSVLVRMPGGRQVVADYLHSLRVFEHAWIYQTNRSRYDVTETPLEALELNPAIPQFPTNTEWALVRRMCVIDSDGRLQATPVVENIQVRRFLQTKRMFEKSEDVQQLFEFQFDRRHNAGLRALGKDEPGFPFVRLQSNGIDPFEHDFGKTPEERRRSFENFRRPSLHTCFECHSDKGIFSVASYTGFLAPPGPEHPVDLAPIDIEREGTSAIFWKQRQYEWGVLQGLWF